MNFEQLIGLHNYLNFGEIQIIGRDIDLEGKPYHVVGLLRKDKRAELLVLGICENLEERTYHRESSRREQMRSSMLSERNPSYFLHIRSFMCDGVTYEVGGATSGYCGCSNYGETYVLFEKLMQAGWMISEDSPFYEVQWEFLEITRVELREEIECLPQWKGQLEIEKDSIPQNSLLEKSVELAIGENFEQKVAFTLQDGREAICYINRVYLSDIWEEEEARFADPAYRERMLQYVSEEQLEQMKEQLFGALADICPQGKCFPVIEYECTQEVSLQFFDKEYLDGVEAPKGNSATSLLMRAKPQSEVGSHGLKMRTCIIQSPMEKAVKQINAELFSYTEVTQRRCEVIEL